MIQFRLVRFTCLLATLLLFSNSVRAQGIRVFAQASGSYLFNDKLFTINGDKFQSNYANGGKVTFGGEYTPWRIAGIELAYGVGRNNIRVTNLSTTPTDTTGYGIRAQRLNANFVVHGPVSVFQLKPYVTAGLEFDRFGPTSDAKKLAFTQGFADQTAVLDSTNKVGVNFGGGVEWNFLPLLGLRFDLRNHTTGTPRYGLPQQSSTGGPVFPVSGAAQNLEFSVGLVFHAKI